VLYLVIAMLVSGLIIGALGRLVVPGRQRMGVFSTALVGIAGSFAGGLIGRVVFGLRYRYSFVLALVIAVACTALLIIAIQGGTRPHRLR
jgi:uncharacterized membrane protein YeaQ/YmgE (transglycosylase-associated protein family)